MIEMIDDQDVLLSFEERNGQIKKGTGRYIQAKQADTDRQADVYRLSSRIQTAKDRMIQDYDGYDE